MQAGSDACQAWFATAQFSVPAALLWESSQRSHHRGKARNICLSVYFVNNLQLVMTPPPDPSPHLQLHLHTHPFGNCQCLFTGSECCSAASGANVQPWLISRVVPVDVIINEAAFKSSPLSVLKLCCVTSHKSSAARSLLRPPRPTGTQVAAAAIRSFINVFAVARS